MMKKIIRIFILSTMILIVALAMPAYASDIDAAEDDIVRIEETGDESYVATFTVANDVVLPLSMNIESETETLLLCIKQNGQSFMISPGKYQVIKAIDGNGKKLTSGATLNILNEDADYYLDFNKPDNGLNVSINWQEVLVINVVFIILAFIAVKLFKKYRNKFAG